MTGAGEAGTAGAYDINVRLDGRWVDVPLRADIDASTWAEALVDEALALRGIDESPQRRMVYVQMYAAVLESERALMDAPDRHVMSLYCLVPEDDLLFVATVHLQGVSLFLGMSMDDVVNELVLPQDQRYGPPTVAQIETSYGTCERISQLAVHDGGEVSTGLQYAWPTPDDGIVLLMSAYFSSPVDAAVYEDAVEELASSLTMVVAR